MCVCSKGSRENFSSAWAQNWWLQGPQCAGTSVLMQSLTAPSDHNHHLSDGERLGTDRELVEDITICQQFVQPSHLVQLQAVIFSSPPWSRSNYNLKQAAGPLCLPLPTHRHPHFATLTQVCVVAGKELPKLLQAGFLPHRHGGSARSILVRDSGNKWNDGPKGKGLLLLKRGPHTGLLCKEQMLQ